MGIAFVHRCQLHIADAGVPRVANGGAANREPLSAALERSSSHGKGLWHAGASLRWWVLGCYLVPGSRCWRGDWVLVAGLSGTRCLAAISLDVVPVAITS